MTRAQWLAEPLTHDVDKALTALCQTEDVVAIAVMPDVHLAEHVCVGTVTATQRRVLPNAVGGDVGCGMAALAFSGHADVLDHPQRAAALLSALYEQIPILRHSRRKPAMSSQLSAQSLSHEALERRKVREAAWQLGTVGRGNHFVEFQRDEQQRLWAMVHSGSRGMGPAIRDHHLRSARIDDRTGIHGLDAEHASGQAYLNDVRWARAYAAENRRTLLTQAAHAVQRTLTLEADWTTLITTDHNHVHREMHGGHMLWVHRKGAQSAHCGEQGIIPGSMASQSFHVVGRGCVAALCSSSHGAGRVMSRSEAHRRITRKQFEKDTQGLWFDHRLSDKLRQESPRAYKDIGRVMRAQRELTQITRTLRPVLVYKGV